METKLTSNWLVDTVLERFIPGPVAVEKRVRNLRGQMPGATDEEICDRLIKKAASRAAAIGAGFTAPAEIPGIGTVLAWLGVPGELVALWTVQAGLVLHIAAVYGYNPQARARASELLSVLGLATTPTVLGEEGVKSLLTLGGTRIIRQIAARVGMRGLERVGTRMLGLLAIGADAGLNAASTYAVGQRAKRYYGQPVRVREVQSEVG